MKLLPLACFAVSAAQSGDYDYGAVDTTEEDDRGYGYSSYGDTNYGDTSYGNYDDYGNKKNKYTFGHHHHQGRAPGTGVIAVALNCWPANFDKDTLMKQDTAEANPAELHLFGPLHLYGSEKDSRYNAGTNSGDPGLRAGMGGHYHYGHSHSDAVENTAPSEWVHYHSARHAGCLYEIPDFSYNAVSWNRIFHLYYYNGYYNTASTPGAVVAASIIPAVPTGYTDPLGAAISFDANWVHFFNAHVLVSSGTGGHGASIDPTLQTDLNSIKLVMANPQYEGLGWLNFVATFARSGIATGQAYTEFADSTIVTLTATEMLTACNGGACGTYTAINDATTAQQTQGTTGNFYYDAWMGTWELRMDDSTTTGIWNTQYTETAAGTTFLSQQMAVSSFPHNELGKDFRFNMRVLLEDSTDSTRIMYYFYKINTITITFPHAVAYALVHDGRETTQGSTTHDGGISSTGNSQGDGVYSVSQNSIRDNIIPPLDLGSHMDSSFGEHVASTDEHHRITGYLSTATADVCTTGFATCADFCRTPSVTTCAMTDTSCAATSLEEFCSTKFHITGLLNTYSERLGGQRGTYQEIWVQLQYAFRLTTSNTLVDGSATEQISSPFPYLHFMASEITSIDYTCDTTNVDNGNTCNAFVTPTTHDFGWGG